MSTREELKEYLLGKDEAIGYLLNDDNNGKTVMLSGAWGSGKTHFWLEDIKPKLIEKKQKNIYISLYGKESIGELKFEVLREAYNLEVKEDFISKTASMISSIAPSLGEKSLVDGYDKLNKAAKEKQAEEILKSGSIICLDDFERKSSKIDLNDLFGYISQLALDYNCKVVIILNSDVFEGEEANVFKRVKEKTVNKYFYFEPTIEELFNSIYNSDEKYKRLDEYKDKILNAIRETEELNARIYIQVLDNCLEWMDKGYDIGAIRSLVFVSINFILNDLILTKPITIKNGYSSSENIVYVEIDYPDKRLCMASPARIISQNKIKFSDMQGQKLGGKEYNLETSLIEKVLEILAEKIKNKQEFSETEQVSIRTWISENRRRLDAIWKYGYRLYYIDSTDESTYKDITNFIKTGILPKNPQGSGEFTPTKG